MAGWIHRQGWQAAMKCCLVTFVVFNFSLYRINRCGLLRLGQNNSEVILLLRITAIYYIVTSILSPMYITLWAKNVDCNVREPMTKCKEWHIKVHAIITIINSTLIIHTGLHTTIRCAILLLFMSANIYKKACKMAVEGLLFCTSVPTAKKSNSIIAQSIVLLYH